MISDQNRLFVVIPAYNEELKIGEVIISLKNSGYHNILVINDGSQDKTGEVAENAGAEVLNHIINRGQGAALRSGIEYLRENFNPEIIITFDADGQHRPEDIQKIIRPIVEEEADIALGSRFLSDTSEIPFSRKLILKGGIIFTNLVSGIRLSDAHNGLRALGKKAIRSLNITQRGMEHASEIIDEIKRKRLKHVEVPVKITYSEYSMQKGQKNSNFIKLGIKIILKKLS